ncbi:hypothetical protein BB559_000120 [Furculomyces boomerangus]|uniref:Septation initiation network scaffold protein cdc11 n=1 Tax=Furculomyces boomerangus TaxID=61424 RepID=A0A2T9Z6F6_9FUNG|nr:hypothetical protein BB559_000120 [Furculomyces boomerangus]
MGKLPFGLSKAIEMANSIRKPKKTEQTKQKPRQMIPPEQSNVYTIVPLTSNTPTLPENKPIQNLSDKTSIDPQLHKLPSEQKLDSEDTFQINPNVPSSFEGVKIEDQLSGIFSPLMIERIFINKPSVNESPNPDNDLQKLDSISHLLWGNDISNNSNNNYLPSLISKTTQPKQTDTSFAKNEEPLKPDLFYPPSNESTPIKTYSTQLSINTQRSQPTESPIPKEDNFISFYREKSHSLVSPSTDVHHRKGYFLSNSSENNLSKPQNIQIMGQNTHPSPETYNNHYISTLPTSNKTPEILFNHQVHTDQANSNSTQTNETSSQYKKIMNQEYLKMVQSDGSKRLYENRNFKNTKDSFPEFIINDDCNFGAFDSDRFPHKTNDVESNKSTAQEFIAIDKTHFKPIPEKNNTTNFTFNKPENPTYMNGHLNTNNTSAHSVEDNKHFAQIPFQNKSKTSQSIHHFHTTNYENAIAAEKISEKLNQPHIESGKYNKSTVRSNVVLLKPSDFGSNLPEKIGNMVFDRDQKQWISLDQDIDKKNDLVYSNNNGIASSDKRSTKNNPDERPNPQANDFDLVNTQVNSKQSSNTTKLYIESNQKPLHLKGNLSTKPLVPFKTSPKSSFNLAPSIPTQNVKTSNNISTSSEPIHILPDKLKRNNQEGSSVKQQIYNNSSKSTSNVHDFNKNRYNNNLTGKKQENFDSSNNSDISNPNGNDNLYYDSKLFTNYQASKSDHEIVKKHMSYQSTKFVDPIFQRDVKNFRFVIPDKFFNFDKDKDSVNITSPFNTSTADALNLEDNNFSSESFLFKLSSWKNEFGSLTKIDLRSCGIRNLGGLSTYFPEIEYLNINDNKVSNLNGIPNSLITLKAKNNWFNLNNKNGEKFLLSKYLPHLEYIDLSENRISEIGIFSGLLHLRQLILSQNQIHTLSSLKSCRRLYTLDVSSNVITKLDLVHTQVPGLENLDISRNRLESIVGVESFSKLKSLNLESNDISIWSLKRPMEQLCVLDLSGNPRLLRSKDYVLENTIISNYLPVLTHLNVNGCHIRSIGSQQFSLSQKPEYSSEKSLSFESNIYSEDVSFESINTYMNRHKRSEKNASLLNKNHIDTRKNNTNIDGSFGNLHSLSLRGNAKTKNSEITLYLEKLPKLENLIVSNRILSFGDNSEALTGLENNRPLGNLPDLLHLTSLELVGCSVESLPVNLGYALPLLEVLDVSMNKMLHTLPDSITNCKKLRILRCQFTSIGCRCTSRFVHPNFTSDPYLNVIKEAREKLKPDLMSNPDFNMEVKNTNGYDEGRMNIFNREENEPTKLNFWANEIVYLLSELSELYEIDMRGNPLTKYIYAPQNERDVVLPVYKSEGENEINREIGSVYGQNERNDVDINTRIISPDMNIQLKRMLLLQVESLGKCERCSDFKDKNTKKGRGGTYNSKEINKKDLERGFGNKYEPNGEDLRRENSDFESIRFNGQSLMEENEDVIMDRIRASMMDKSDVDFQRSYGDEFTGGIRQDNTETEQYKYASELSLKEIDSLKRTDETYIAWISNKTLGRNLVKWRNFYRNTIVKGIPKLKWLDGIECVEN